MEKTKKNTILVVDDEQLVIQTLVEILSSEYTVLVEKGGIEAIDKAKRLLPDVILLDIIMPEMDGYDVITVLKSNEETKDIPVIFITGLGDDYSEEKGLSLGAADYMVKPFKPGIVKLRVRNQIKIIERNAIESNLNVVLKLQSELVAAKEQAEHSSRVKGEFLSRMSHEMRTPLNAITGMTRLMKMRPDRAKECLEEIENATSHLLGMINDVLDISGMEYGAIKLYETEFSFRAMVEGVLKETAGFSEAKVQQISTHIDDSVPEILIGDEKRLEQILICLLSNAIKFTPDSGEINIKARITGEDDKKCTVEVTVEDNGIGISKEEQKGIFDIFEQVDGSNKREHDGIGVGLALSKRIIEMMGGRIIVISEPSKGSTFRFTCILRKAN